MSTTALSFVKSQVLLSLWTSQSCGILRTSLKAALKFRLAGTLDVSSVGIFRTASETVSKAIRSSKANLELN